MVYEICFQICFLQPGRLRRCDLFKKESRYYKTLEPCSKCEINEQDDFMAKHLPSVLFRNLFGENITQFHEAETVIILVTGTTIGSYSELV